MNKRLFTGVFFLVLLAFMAGQSYSCPILKAIIGRFDVRPAKPTWVYAGGGVGFVACESVGSIVNCTWSLPGASDVHYEDHLYPNAHVSCKYSTVGQYTVTLTVRDSQGRTDTDTCTVYVVSIGIGIATGESKYVAVNNDDDNDNGVMDLSNDEVTVEHEDTLPYDLRKILLYVQTPKTSDKVCLGVGPEEWAAGMRVWGQRNKGTLIIENQDGQPWVNFPAWSSSEPHDVYLEARHAFSANQMFLAFGYVGIDGSTTPPTERVPEGNPPDPIHFTLLEVDVDIEGVKDDEYSYGPVAEECKPGGFITLNDDDDNKNGIADKDETGPVTNEDELVKIDLTHPLRCEDPQNLPINFLYPITLKAIAGGEKVKVWGNPTKEGTPITLPVSWTSRDSIPYYLWVEGVQISSTPRDITLALEYAGFEDRIRLTVFKLDVEIYTNGSWHNVTDDNITVLNGTKYPFRAILDPELAPWPSDKFSWSGIASGSNQMIEVTFDSIGSQTLTATFCSCSRNVTINTIQPELNTVRYAITHPIHNVLSPQYQRDPYRNGPACWTMGAQAMAHITFWHSQNLTFPTENIVVRAETSGDYWNIADWGDSSPSTFGTPWPTDEILCMAEGHINNQVEYRDYSAQWKYKVPWGTNEWITTTTQNNCRLYVVLDTPTEPQDKPWIEVLDISCSLAWGCDTETEAMDEIWDDFYDDAGGVYDTDQGAPRYTNNGEGSDFNLTRWLSRYKQTPPIGTVNCYDMAKAVVVFANALGCGASNTYVEHFGYPNCIYPIGCGWANNPFYSSPHYDNNPVVDGDAADDGIPNNHAGRSAFANHAFARLGESIYDASLGCVDVDLDPDDGPIHFPYRYLDGEDTWTNTYRNRVIDNVPAPPSGTSTPTNHNFGIY